MWDRNNVSEVNFWCQPGRCIGYVHHDLFLRQTLRNCCRTVLIKICDVAECECSAVDEKKSKRRTRNSRSCSVNARPIHARSLLPCMDTPSVKHPYKAQVHNFVPKPSPRRYVDVVGEEIFLLCRSAFPNELVCLMSAVQTVKPIPSAEIPGFTTYHFEQKVCLIFHNLSPS